MKKSRFILLLGIITATCLLPVGKADWSALKKSDTLVVSSSTAVCYIGSTKFTTLDDALYYAEANNENDKIYVIPGLNAELKIEKSHTINEGDALLLPYDTPDTDDDKIASTTGSDYSSFADNIASNRKTLVTLGANVELTIDGTLSIGAITGSKEDNKPQGQASSSYCEIKMGNNSKLVVNGELNCYGFIKDSDNSNSSIIVNGLVDGVQKAGTITTPVVFYDFSGGSDATAYQANGVFPFSQFDISQIRPKITFNYGSSLIGVARVYVKSGDYFMTIDANLLGTSDASKSSFIIMDAGSSIDWQYSNKSPNGITDDASTGTSNSFQYHSTSISLYGSLAFGRLNVSGVDSSKYYLPIPYGYSISVEKDATFTLPDYVGSNKITGAKFMPGSSLECKSGATINFNAGILFYQGTVSSDKSTNITSAYPDGVKPAICLNNGTMNINAGFEGNITTSNSKSGGASVVFGTDYKPITDSKESTSKAVYNWGGAFGKIKGSNSDAYFVKTNTYTSASSEDFWNENKTDKKDNIAKFVVTIDNISTGETGTMEFGSAAVTASTYKNPNNAKDYTWKLNIQILTDEEKDYDGQDVRLYWKFSNKLCEIKADDWGDWKTYTSATTEIESVKKALQVKRLAKSQTTTATTLSLRIEQGTENTDDCKYWPERKKTFSGKWTYQYQQFKFNG